MIDDLLRDMDHQIKAATRTVVTKPRLVLVSHDDYAEIRKNDLLYGDQGLPERDGVPIRPSNSIASGQVQIVV